MSRSSVEKAEIIERLVAKRRPRFMLDELLHDLTEVPEQRVEARLSRVRTDLEQKTLVELREQEAREEIEMADFIKEVEAM